MSATTIESGTGTSTTQSYGRAHRWPRQPVQRVSDGIEPVVVSAGSPGGRRTVVRSLRLRVTAARVPAGGRRRFSLTLRPDRPEDVRWIVVLTLGLDGDYAFARPVRVR